jgi:hypothetical protein
MEEPSRHVKAMNNVRVGPPKVFDYSTGTCGQDPMFPPIVSPFF